MKKVSEVSFQLKFPKNIKIKPVLHVSSLEPHYKDNRFKRKQYSPPPIILNDSHSDIISTILGTGLIPRIKYGLILQLLV